MGIKYLGAAGSKKWLLAMDGGARPAPSQKRPFPPDGELVELLWRNGAVVARSQAQGHNYHQREVVRRGPSGGNTGASGVTEDAAWLPDANALGGDTYAQLWRDVARLEGWVDADTATSAFWPPPPATSGGAGSSRTTGGEVGSSFCGSNNLVTAALLRTGASTSGWTESGALLRRSRDEVDGRGEDADFDETRRPASKRRTRSTQVHNMSERRRRDRFNEKMRALQELVPHCNKTDKASILDEAIEYLKSLQMQVQIMWMTTGMAPMMIPGGHQELMGTGLNSSSMPPAAHVPSQMQRVAPFMNNPLPNQMPGVSSAATGAQNEASQVQKNQVGGPRNPFFHPDDAPAATAEVPSLFGCGSQMAHQNYFQDLLANTAAPPFGAEQPSSFDGTGTT